MDLTGNTYIVTGASKGFGLAITQALLEAGANVGMIARNNEHLQHTVAELSTDSVVGIAGDVADTEQMTAAFEHGSGMGEMLGGGRAHQYGIDFLVIEEGNMVVVTAVNPKAICDPR